MEQQPKFDVALLGCGNMGAALGRALLAAGYSVTAWNRSPEKSRALEPFGARSAHTADQAVGSARATITCLRTYDDVEKVLGTVDMPDGHTLINVTTGSPRDADRLRRWAETQRVQYLDGAILAFPEQIGTRTCQLLVAGSPEIWEANRELIRAMGGASRHVSGDAKGANVLDLAGVGAFYGVSILGFIEAARYVTACGVPVDELLLVARQLDGILHTAQQQCVESLTTGDFSTDQATIDVYHSGSVTFRETLTDRLGSAPMVEAAAELLGRGVDAGLSEQSLYALFKLYDTRDVNEDVAQAG
ncbi:3-hydroxyisobutyrate dehydrogenase [Nocardia amikacinitolerans]|uniref:NAD(P)-dependent oxidoreductase n=1 Tax=Nocardia amikacinitolerans TaxID=756689 RepID=UPI000AB0ADDA|nr:NAD(P)-binding domain-containing protein [Nocardia amikacinitolerans]MCP2319329.1 3-hydroxyisobutyrate dehydrogenase [Nocardia amikacinitolerans]